MAIPLSFTFFFSLLLLLGPSIIFSFPLQDPNLVVEQVHKYNSQSPLTQKFKSSYIPHIYNMESLFYNSVSITGASMSPEETWVFFLVEQETPLMIVGGVTQIGKATGRA